MKDKVKKALKRGASGLLAVLLAVCLVGTPRAKAVFSEGALLGSIFGSLLVSMGYSWAADNMDAPSFGEAIYKLTQEFDEDMKDTGAQLIRDLNLAGLTAAGPGRARFTQQWVQAARSFAEWFQGKFFSGGNTSASVVQGLFSFETSNFWEGPQRGILNYPYTFTASEYYASNSSWDIKFKDIPITKPGVYSFQKVNDKLDGTIFIDTIGFYLNGYILDDSNRNYTPPLSSSDPYYQWTITQEQVDNGITMRVWLTSWVKSINAGETIPIRNVHAISFDGASTLTAEKPQEVHYPDVAEDGSQVYEITVDGVTATDIEGIIQGAVDRILAGTAAIAGSIADAQAGTGEEVANPEIDPYKVGLSSVFPFCIPFDVYNMVTMFVAEPEAPHAEWTFTLPWGSQDYSIGWDLAAFDGVAQVCRSMELVLFAVGLAVMTYKVIKW